MYLRNLICQGFRSCRDSQIQFQSDLTILVGENNGGKSNVIDAIRLLTYPLNGRRDRYPDETDLSRGAGSDSFELSATFSDLSATARANLIWALGDPRGSDATFGVNYTLQSPTKAKSSYWAGRYKESHHDSSYTEAVRHVYLPPLRDAQKSLGSGSAKNIVTLLKHFLKSDDEAADFINHVKRDETPHRVIKDLNSEIAGALDNITSGVRQQGATLGFTQEELIDVARDLRFRMADSGIDPEDIARSGLGYANLLYMATVMVELSKANDADLTIFLVEEPEAHLHPQLQSLVLSFLRDRARESQQTVKPPGEPEGKIQVIVTTHSPNLTASIHPSHLVVVRSNPVPGQEKERQTSSIPIAKISMKDAQLNKVSRYIDVTKSSILFGTRGMLVEGVAELLLIPVLAKNIVFKSNPGAWRRFTGSSLISVDGVDFLPYLLLLLSNVDGFSIFDNLIIVTDNDPDSRGDRSATFKQISKMLGSEDKLNVFTNRITLEHELFIAENEAVLKKAFLRCCPSSGEKWDQWIDSTEQLQRANQFIALLKDSRVKKGQFSQNLSSFIEDGENFIIPDYIESAIRELAE